MKKIYYNKLIRDKIPDRITQAGAKYSVKRLGRKKFEKELIKKVEEEASGMQSSKNKKELIGEIADVIEVINEIKKIKKIRESEINAARRKNMQRKGGFNKKLFLFWSSDDGYKTNEKRYDKRRGRFPKK